MAYVHVYRNHRASKVNSVLVLLRRVFVGDVATISEMHAASIFKVGKCVCWGGVEWGLVPLLDQQE